MQKTLNTDQKNAVTYLLNWYDSAYQCTILAGRGGVGKTYTIEEFLKQLWKKHKVSTILLAPTHEAVYQMRLALKDSDDYDIKTVQAALGVTPTMAEKELQFEQMTLPSFWQDIELVIVDEGSMLDQYLEELLLKLNVKILFIGHGHQLPPVKRNRKLDDPCISPIFESSRDYPEFTLTIPQRNTGDLWNFCNIIDNQVEGNEEMIIPPTYNVNRHEFETYIRENLNDFASGNLKYILWKNESVDRANVKIRKLIYGKDAEIKYLPNDKIIFTSPYTFIDKLDRHILPSLLKLSLKRDQLEYAYSNSKGTVLGCTMEIVHVVKDLSIPCYVIKFLDYEGEARVAYNPILPEHKQHLKHYLEQRAYASAPCDRKKAFREMFFILSCFADIKHFYGATAHRSQGASINKVIVNARDIKKNPNIYEQKKCLYVAYSRAKYELLNYEGLEI